MLPRTSYLRHKGYVRIQIFIRMQQVNLVPLYIMYTRTYIQCVARAGPSLQFQFRLEMLPGN